MPDITMCTDKECPQRQDCYRFMAKPNEFRQSYFMQSPRKDNKCEHFYEIGEELAKRLAATKPRKVKIKSDVKTNKRTKKRAL